MKGINIEQDLINPPLHDKLRATPNCESLALYDPAVTFLDRRWQQRQLLALPLSSERPARATGNEDECVGTDPPVLGRFESGSV